MEKIEQPTSEVVITDQERGRWGEDIRGDGVEIEQAEYEFQELTRELSRLSQVQNIRSRASAADDEQSIGFEDKTEQETEGFNLAEWIKNDTEKSAQSGIGLKKIGVCFKNLSVIGVDSGANIVPNVWDAVVDGVGGSLIKWVKSKIPSLRPEVPIRTILYDFNGLVRSGEMLLVLGSPGSGTTTLLKVLTNQREGYASVDGEVLYDGIDHITAKKKYRGEIVFNEEDDRHISTLTVKQTLKFALSLKTPRVRAMGESSKDFVNKLVDLYGKMFGISHTMNTLVSGVSGGEKKRVSIAEVLANRAAIVAFDNSTRGLDSSTAVDYIRSLRILTNLTYCTTIVTLYQAGESLYEEFDKVCLIDSGRQIFFGPASEASAYFESLGFERERLMTTADFLTSITHPAERKIRTGWEGRAPQTPEDLEAAYKASKFYTQTLADVESYETELANTGHETVAQFHQAVQLQKSKTVGRSSPYMVSFFKQVKEIVVRDLQLQWQDQALLKVKVINAIVVAFTFGSLFFNLNLNTSGAYARGGILFFIMCFTSWILQVAAAESISERPLLSKHVGFGMFRKSAYILAKTVADFPIIFSQVALFFVIVYLMVNAHRTAGAFFVCFLFVELNTFMMMAFYRAFAVFCGNVDSCLRYCAIVLNCIYFWAGYVRPASNMQWWFRWFYYCDPVLYSFESILVNEFHGREMKCDTLVPDIEGASLENQACAVPGAVTGRSYVSGEDYLAAQLDFWYVHLWRNFGIILGFFVFFVSFQMIFSEIVNHNSSSAQTKYFTKPPTQEIDSRLKCAELDKKGNSSDGSDEVTKDSSVRGSLFTFRDITYTVPTSDGDKLLLDHVEGFAAPGKLLALMGSSGAGKTTLLNTISQRMSVGVVTGDFKLNGGPLDKAFQRTTGFVEQKDLHEPKQTIREALRFSARLRQPASVTLEDKYSFVEEIIDLLDLRGIADAIIDDVGFGLSVEERKRVTIGVELAARPSILFLDEPTSGLDSEGSFSIITFLRRLALQSGIGIICTIHQPSAVLFSKFDNILLLGRGGKTVYFGPIGENGSVIVGYISRHAKPPRPGDNPAEYILEATGAGATRRSTVNWPQVWRESDEIMQRRREIDILEEEWKQNPPPIREGADSDAEYAAPIFEQIKAVTMRHWLTMWRTPSLGYSFLFAALFTGITGGILFFDLGNSIVEAQDRGFAVYFILLATIPVINSYEIHFINARDLYELRERRAKIFSWVALVTAYILCIIPYLIIGAVLFYPTFWYMTNLPTNSSAAGYGFFMILILFLWNGHIGIFMGGFVPSMNAVGVINPLFFVSSHLTIGISIPYTQMNGFYKYFIYWINPLSWMIRGLFSTAIHGVEINCADTELAVFNPPTGMTCNQYAGEWVHNSTLGVLLNPEATESCKYCQYATGDDFLTSIGFSYSTRWRDLGVSIAFIFLNVVLCYASYYFARECTWIRPGRLIRSFKKLFK
ncbi:ABC-2 type transporter-domain-containing protein [Dipodascopsis uninucleata]